MTVWVVVSRYRSSGWESPRCAGPDQAGQAGGTGAAPTPQRRGTRQKARWRREVAATRTKGHAAEKQDGDVKSPLQERRGKRQKARWRREVAATRTKGARGRKQAGDVLTPVRWLPR